MKDWIKIAAFGAAAAAVFWLMTLLPSDEACKPDPHGVVFQVVIGGSMLLAGCPEKR